MRKDKNRVCPVERAGHLDNRIRRWFQNPHRILRPYVMEGMTVLDVGCGPGFFTVAMAELVGAGGRVVAADLQEGMLEKLAHKIRGTELEPRIVLHKCEQERIGVPGRFDFILLFYVVHEISDKEAFFTEMEGVLKPEGRILMVEPPFHVSRSAFKKTLDKARGAGLVPIERHGFLLSRAAVLGKTRIA